FEPLFRLWNRRRWTMLAAMTVPPIAWTQSPHAAGETPPGAGRTRSAIMAIGPISVTDLLANTPLSQLGQLGQAGGAGGIAQGPGGAGAAGGTGLDFGKILESALSGVDQAQTQADDLAKRFQLGDESASLESAIIAMQKANINF